jgi:hypothetical protein
MKVYLLLDRSGSMAGMWAESINSINAYVSKLPRDVKVTVAAFDDVEPFKILREDVVAVDWKPLDAYNEVQPRGMTPLYDAAGKMLTKMFKDDPRKAVFVVMTDGAENNSKEYTRDSVKTRVKDAEEAGWGVVFLGANFDKVDAVSASVGARKDYTAYVAAGNMTRAMDNLAVKTDCWYNEVNTAFSSFTSAELADLADKKEDDQDKKKVKSSA